MNTIKRILSSIGARLALVVLGILVVIVGLVAPNRCVTGLDAAFKSYRK